MIPRYFFKLGGKRFRRKIVVKNLSRKRELQRLIQSFYSRQCYYVSCGDWSRVVDLDIKLEVLRRELYGSDYYGQ